MTLNNHGVIYKIESKNEDFKKIYIGSTFNFNLRIKQHNANNIYEKRPHYKYKLYKNIRDQGGFINFNFIKLEEHTNIEKKFLKQKEEKYINDLKPELNTARAYFLDYENSKHHQKKREKIKCIFCGRLCARTNKATHEKSKRCKKKRLINYLILFKFLKM